MRRPEISSAFRQVNGSRAFTVAVQHFTEMSMIEQSAGGRPRAEVRRRQILDAACACVRRAGFHGASMAEIAKAANLSVGQIYRYFDNKEAIVAAIADQDLAEMREKFAELETSGHSLVDSVIALSADAVDYHYDRDRAALVLEVLAEAARNPRVAAIVQAADVAERALARGLFDRARADGCGQAELNARAEVLSMLFEGMTTRAVNNPNVDRESLAVVLSSMLRHLLTAAPAIEAQSAPKEPAAP